MQPNGSDIGVNNMDAWDLLWSIGKYAQQAASLVKPGQLVNMLPGLHMLALKKQLLILLIRAYGAAATSITPVSFELPAGLVAWRQWVADHPRSSTLWMLKSEDDRARGLRLATTPEAFEVALQPAPGKAFPQFAVAQQYVERPLLLHSRKFHMRAWMLVTGTRPLRAYLHRNGLVLFATSRYEPEAAVESSKSSGRPPLGHITNYAQNVDGSVWGLAQLAQELGPGPWRGVWQQMLRSAAMTAAAGLAAMLEEQQRYRMLADSGFELLGLDFLLDSSLHPWLLEVNRMPVLAVKHSDQGVRAVIHDQKWGAVRDMLRMLVHRVQRAQHSTGGTECGAEHAEAAAAPAAAAAAVGCEGGSSRGGARSPSLGPTSWMLELEQRGGYVPLMPHMPLQPGGGKPPVTGGARQHGEDTPTTSIPWDASDFELQGLMQDQPRRQLLRHLTAWVVCLMMQGGAQQHGEDTPTASIPWDASDFELQRLMQDRSHAW